VAKLPEPPAYDVWKTAAGRTMHGRRCQRINKHTGRQCEQRARAGFTVCGKHGAGHAARVARGERTDVTTSNLRTGLHAERLKNTLKDKIAAAEMTFDAIGAARKSGATTQTLLDEYIERLSANLEAHESEEGFVAVSQEDLDNLIVLASQLSRTAKHLSDIESKEQLTFEDLMFIAKQLAALFVQLSLGHIHEPNARSQFLEDAEAGLSRIFSRASDRGVVEANHAIESLVPATVRRR